MVYSPPYRSYMRKKSLDRSAPRPPSSGSPIKQSTSVEEALVDANQRLRAILIANEVATWTWDVAKDIVIADDNMGRLFGVAAHTQGPIENYLTVIHPEDRPNVAAAIRAAVEGPDDRYAIDYRVVRQDGTISWLTARGKVERDKDGKAKYFPGVVVDITDRKTSEQNAEELRFRLAQQASLFDITLSSISDFAYIFDRDGRFIYVNRALLELWGLKLEEAIGKNFFDLKYPAELAERLQRQIQQVFDTKKGLIDETPYTSPTGAGGYYEYIFRPVFDRRENVEAVAGSTRDITEHKRTENQLRLSEEHLRRLAETLETQVTARTVELEERNNDVLRQSEQLRELSISLMETQDREARRLARDLHDSSGQIVAGLLMSLARMVKELEASNPDLAKLAKQTRSFAEELDKEIRTASYLLHPPMLDEIGLQAAVQWYAEGLGERAGIKIELEFPNDFERLSRDMEITVFRVIQECLTNIHRHSGSKSAYIRLAREQNNLRLEVGDAGRGIAPGDLNKVRERGVGVGLRGIQERVRQLAGEVRIDSRPGEGTRVLVTLPVPEGSLATRS